MWVNEETEDELTVKNYPLMLWGLASFIFIMNIIITNRFLQYIGGLSNIAEVFAGISGRKGADTFLLYFLLVWWLALLIWFYFIPLTITKFNRNKQIISQIKYSLFGKRTREFAYSDLRGGVREKKESNGKYTHSSVYFETQAGKKISLNTETSWSDEINRQIMEKANKYLQSKSENKT